MIIRLGGNANDANSKYVLGDRKRDRACLVKKEGVYFYRIFNKKINIGPFDNKIELPRNNIKILQKSQTDFVPMGYGMYDFNESGVLAVALSEEEKVMAYNTIDRLEKEHAKQDFWSTYGPYVVPIVTVIVCMVVTGLTVWWVFKFAGTSVGQVMAAAKTGVQTVTTSGLGEFANNLPR